MSVADADSGAESPKLTRAAVVGAAIELADADGFGAVTMRKIADRLGVGTMSSTGTSLTKMPCSGPCRMRSACAFLPSRRWCELAGTGPDRGGGRLGSVSTPSVGAAGVRLAADEHGAAEPELSRLARRGLHGVESHHGGSHGDGPDAVEPHRRTVLSTVAERLLSDRADDDDEGQSGLMHLLAATPNTLRRPTCPNSSERATRN